RVRRELGEVVEIVAKDFPSGSTTFTWSDPSAVEWLTYLARRWGERAFSSSGEGSRPGQAAPGAADARANLIRSSVRSLGPRSAARTTRPRVLPGTRTPRPG